MGFTVIFFNAYFFLKRGKSGINLHHFLPTSNMHTSNYIHLTINALVFSFPKEEKGDDKTFF